MHKISITVKYCDRALLLEGQVMGGGARQGRRMYVRLSDFSHIYDSKNKRAAPRCSQKVGEVKVVDSAFCPRGGLQDLRKNIRFPRGNRLDHPQICTLFTRYALANNPEKPVPTRDAAGVKTCRGEYLVELHRCSPHILWLHWGQFHGLP